VSGYITATAPLGVYSSFSPDDALFRAEVHLLGTTQTAVNKIPPISAWRHILDLTLLMRALNYLLMSLAGISTDAPFKEHLSLL
jgi:hypothetical protein